MNTAIAVSHIVPQFYETNQTQLYKQAADNNSKKQHTTYSGEISCVSVLNMLVFSFFVLQHGKKLSSICPVQLYFP